MHMHPSSPSLFYLCHFRSPSHPDGKPLSHSQLLPSLCFLHVISHCVLSALILNPHICSFFPFSLSSSLFETLSLLLGVGNLIGLFVSYLLFAHQYKPSHPALVRAAALSDAFRPNSLWKLLPLPVLSPTVPSPSHMFYKITLLLTHWRYFPLLFSILSFYPHWFQYLIFSPTPLSSLRSYVIFFKTCLTNHPTRIFFLWTFVTSILLKARSTFHLFVCVS